MKPVLHMFTAGLFWLGWPVWFVYFRIYADRSRVIVRANEQVLLVRPWLGPGAWGLPGGGRHRNETLAEAACRELFEEVGIAVLADNLQAMGKYQWHRRGLAYTAHYFLLELDMQPVIKRQWYEIMDAAWFDEPALTSLTIDEDLRLVQKLLRAKG